MTFSELAHYKAVIYDMDGVLIDSEPLWKIAMEEVFRDVDCKLTRKDFEKTVGLRLDEVIHYWYTVIPWEKHSPEVVLQMIIERMRVLIRQNGEPLPGVIESLEFFKARGLKIALATSSYQVLIDTVLEVLDIRHFFEKTHSAEYENYGKPHPDVYINTAKMLGVNPLECLVIEDSINGVIAGKSARMHVICIPEKSHNPNPKLSLADETFESLEELVKNMVNVV